MRYLTIRKATRGTFGAGYEIQVTGYPEIFFCGYTRRQAEAIYRAEYGLKGRRFLRVEY